MSDQTNCCGCAVETVKLPVLGLTFDVDPSDISQGGGGLSREEIQEIVREELRGFSGGDGISYSFEEQWTGKYWVDGKKIYQKSLTASSPAVNAGTVIAHGVANIDSPVDIFGVHKHNHATYGLRFRPLPDPWNTTTTKCYNQGLIFTKTEVLWSSSGVAKPGTAVITIQYTCTDR